MKKFTFLFIPLLCFQCTLGQMIPNYDENKVPDFELPEVLIGFSGEPIETVSAWEDTRRPELLEAFTSQIYGRVPGILDALSFEVIESQDNALNGKAYRKQVLISLQRNDQLLHFQLLMYLPKKVEKAPLFLGYNFYGNHTVHSDPDIIISNAWSLNNEAFGITDHTLTEASRGAASGRWAINEILENGFGLATIYYGEIDPDKVDFSDGIHPLFYTAEKTSPSSEEWGSIAAWAWGLSRAMDYLEQDVAVDASKVIVFGHSRLGKASLWAGATDTRFAGVISNNSGCGGAALSKRRFGETISHINTQFPHWFCGTFKQYNNRESELRIDQHQLLALIAPRLLYVASAEEDKWADPKGEFLAAKHASAAYSLYGKSGIASKEMPPTHTPIHQSLAYHIRKGRHDVTKYDWEQYIKWAKYHFK